MSQLSTKFARFDGSENKEYYAEKTPQGGFFLGDFLSITMLNYFKEVRSEMKHVSWPTRQQALVYTGVVIAVSLLVSAYLGVWDYVFSLVIRNII